MSDVKHTEERTETHGCVCERTETHGDLISRKAAIDECDLRGAEHIGYAIAHLPSVGQEIVRCKDCKHKYIEEKVWNCPFGLPGGEESFCSYGARMDRENDE